MPFATMSAQALLQSEEYEPWIVIQFEKSFKTKYISFHALLLERRKWFEFIKICIEHTVHWQS